MSEFNGTFRGRFVHTQRPRTSLTAARPEGRFGAREEVAERDDEAELQGARHQLPPTDATAPRSRNFCS